MAGLILFLSFKWISVGFKILFWFIKIFWNLSIFRILSISEFLDIFYFFICKDPNLILSKMSAFVWWKPSSVVCCRLKHCLETKYNSLNFGNLLSRTLFGKNFVKVTKKLLNSCFHEIFFSVRVKRLVLIPRIKTKLD